MNTKRRLFIGIPLSAPFRKRLTQEMAAFPPQAALLTRPENLHVTLLFLGFVQETEIPEVCERVGEVCERSESFELEFSSIQLLDSPEQPKQIWLAGEVSTGLKQLREEMEKAFSAFVSEKKAYRPHVTLAKIKKQKWLALSKPSLLPKALHLIEPVDTVCVYESITIDGKRRYEPIDTFTLL